MFERGRSEAECIEKIRAKYGNSYMRISTKTVPCRGFFSRLLSQYEYEVEYMPHPHPTDFISERDKILNSPQVTSAQMQMLTTKLDELSKKIENSKMPASDEHESIQRIGKILRDENDFSAKYTEKIKNRLKTEFSLENLDDFALVQQRVMEWIGDDIKIKRFVYKKGSHPVVALVGSTGVGKTTTIAKLAAIYSNEKKSGISSLSIHLISADYYKIGGQEGLSKYAELLASALNRNVSFSKAVNAADLIEMLDFYRFQKDLIFVDTIGASPKDFEQIAKIRTGFSSEKLPVVFFLTVPASMQATALENIMNEFSQFNYQALVITKLDEVVAVGPLLSVLANSGKAICFLSDTQKVPGDVYDANALILLRKLNGFDVDWSELEKRFGEEEKSAPSIMN